MESLKHKEIEEKGYIEMYLLKKLSPEEETAFEEHLLYCSDCRNELQRLEEIIKGIEDTMYNTVMHPEKSEMNSFVKRKSTRYGILPGNLLRLAASIVLLIGLAGLIYYYFVRQSEKSLLSGKKENMNQEKHNESIPVTDSMKVIHARKKDKPDAKADHSEEQYAANFETNQFYENMVKNIVRSGDFIMTEPEDSIAIKPGTIIKFSWKTDENGVIELIILNNKGQTILQQKAGSSAYVSKLSTPGLYYWKLDTRDETLAAGKIYVKN